MGDSRSRWAMNPSTRAPASPPVKVNRMPRSCIVGHGAVARAPHARRERGGQRGHERGEDVIARGVRR
jgi:hypothetical protein